MLVVLTAAVYLVAVLYRKSGSFSVAIDKYEMTKYGISLSESRDLTHLQSHLDARINEEMTNITGSDCMAAKSLKPWEAAIYELVE
jgi:hypothetical protein